MDLSKGLCCCSYSQPWTCPSTGPRRTPRPERTPRGESESAFLLPSVFQLGVWHVVPVSHHTHCVPSRNNSGLCASGRGWFEGPGRCGGTQWKQRSSGRFHPYQRPWLLCLPRTLIMMCSWCVLMWTVSRVVGRTRKGWRTWA